MLKNAQYIVDNVLIADGVNTTLDYIHKTTGVDISIKNFYTIETPGIILQNKTIVGKYKLVEKREYEVDGYKFKGWFLNEQKSYIAELNEGIHLNGVVGYIILRSSLNRNGATTISAVWDDAFTTANKDGTVVNTMSVRLTVDNPTGIYIEENARIGQLLIFDSPEGAEEYAGQYQCGGNNQLAK